MKSPVTKALLSEADSNSNALPEKKRALSSKRIWILTVSFMLIIVLALSSMLFFLSSSKPQKKFQNPLLASVSQDHAKPKRKNLKEVMGFLPSWAAFPDIDFIKDKGLTQIIYFGLGVTSSGQIIRYNEENNLVAEWSIFTSSEFREFVSSAHKKGIKVVVALKNFDNTSIDTLISNESSTKILTNELVAIARKYDIDGYNLDFEYFTDSEFPTKTHFNKFLGTLNNALEESNPGLSLSIDMNALATISDAAYDMPKIGELVDFIIIMGYDYHLPTSQVAGPIAPLYSVGGSHSVSRTVDSLSGKVPFQKVVLGVPFYGYEWATYGKYWGSQTIPGSGALASYKRVKKLLEDRNDIKTNWDVRTQTPWLVYIEEGSIKQIHYEDSRSIAAKVGFVRDHSMAGIAIWALGYEGSYTDIWKGIVDE